MGLLIGFLCMFALYMLWLRFFINSLFEKYAYFQKPECTDNPKYPAFTRSDYLLWSRCKLYLGGIFLLPIRCFFITGLILMGFLELLLISVIFRVKDFTQPQSSAFLRISKFFLRLNCRLILFFFGFYYIPTRTIPSAGSEYLRAGPDAPNAIIVSNHISFIDVFFFLSQARPVCFVSNQLVKGYPLVGLIAQIIQCVFVNRKVKESKINCLADIQRRSEHLAQNPKSRIGKSRIFWPLGARARAD